MGAIFIRAVNLAIVAQPCHSLVDVSEFGAPFVSLGRRASDFLVSAIIGARAARLLCRARVAPRKVTSCNEILIVVRAYRHELATHVEEEVVLVVDGLKGLDLELVRYDRLVATLLVEVYPPVLDVVVDVVKHFVVGAVLHGLVDQVLLVLFEPLFDWLAVESELYLGLHFLGVVLVPVLCVLHVVLLRLVLPFHDLLVLLVFGVVLPALSVLEVGGSEALRQEVSELLAVQVLALLALLFLLFVVHGLELLEAGALFFLEVAGGPDRARGSDHHRVPTAAANVNDLLLHFLNVVRQKDVLRLRNAPQNIRAEADLPIRVVTPAKECLLDEPAFLVPSDLEPQLLVLVDALDAEIVNPEVLVEVLDHGSGHFLVDCHFGRAREASLFDESRNLLGVPLGNGRDLLPLKGQEVLIDVELDYVIQLLDVPTFQRALSLLWLSYNEHIFAFSKQSELRLLRG